MNCGRLDTISKGKLRKQTNNVARSLMLTDLNLSTWPSWWTSKLKPWKGVVSFISDLKEADVKKKKKKKEEKKV